MTNHLMSGHASPTALTPGTHPGQSVEYFVAVLYFAESFHFGNAEMHNQKAQGEGILYHSPVKISGRPTGKAQWPFSVVA
ncbi:MAG: hypothetical protein WA603_24505 [Candidatus Acidiferrales bacterium]